jgi:hypothetical protein
MWSPELGAFLELDDFEYLVPTPDLKKALRDLARHPPGKDDDTCQ